MQSNYQNRWNEIKSDIQKTFGGISSEDLEKAKDSPQKLVETIQKKLGSAQDFSSVETKVDSILKKYNASDEERANKSKH